MYGQARIEGVLTVAQSVVSDLLEAFRAGEGVDLVRESVPLVLQELIEAEASAVIGATRYERTPERVSERNGSQRAAAGTRLRNLTLLAQPFGETSPLDLVVDREVQAAWLHITADDDVDEVDEHRTLIAERRIKSRARLDELRKHPQFDELVTSIANYVAFVIPWPQQTERVQWTLTALPSTSRNRDNRRLATLSIHNVEVLVLGESREPDGAWFPTRS